MQCTWSILQGYFKQGRVGTIVGLMGYLESLLEVLQKGQEGTSSWSDGVLQVGLMGTWSTYPLNQVPPYKVTPGQVL